MLFRSGEACIHKRQPLGRKAASAAIADVLNHARQALLRAFGQEQPSLDRLAIEAAESYIEGFHQAQAEIGRRELRVQWLLPRLSERLAPEAIEVGRLVARRQVAL